MRIENNLEKVPKLNFGSMSVVKSRRIMTPRILKIVSEYDQEILQSQIADKPMPPRGRATQQSRDGQEDKPSKATSSLFPIKMIAKLEQT